MPTDGHVTVTVAGEDDWRAVRDLRLASLRDAPDAFCSTHAEQEVGDGATWRARVSRPGVTTLVAWLDAAPVGMALVTPWDEPGCFGLGGVWVAPAGRGHGVADALLRRAREVASHVTEHQLALDL